MSEQSEIPQMEQLEAERGQQIVNEVLEKLKYAIQPELKPLRVLPFKFMTIPGLQRFSMAFYKFKKYLGSYYVLFADDEFAVKYDSYSVEVFIKSRTSQTIYYHIYHNDYSMPESLRPRYKDLVDDASPIISAETEREIVQEIFALQLNLMESHVYRQGHLFAILISTAKNLEKWVVENNIDKIFGHQLKELTADKLTDEIFYINIPDRLVVESADHGVHVLPRGEYILYHPREVD